MNKYDMIWYDRFICSFIHCVHLKVMNFIHQGTDTTILLSKDTDCAHTKDIHTHPHTHISLLFVCVCVCVCVCVSAWACKTDLNFIALVPFLNIRVSLLFLLNSMTFPKPKLHCSTECDWHRLFWLSETLIFRNKNLSSEKSNITRKLGLHNYFNDYTKWKIVHVKVHLFEKWWYP